VFLGVREIECFIFQFAHNFIDDFFVKACLENPSVHNIEATKAPKLTGFKVRHFAMLNLWQLQLDNYEILL
jgi:hypothetical protein